jgi:hypothetical protein
MVPSSPLGSRYCPLRPALHLNMACPQLSVSVHMHVLAEALHVAMESSVWQISCSQASDYTQDCPVHVRQSHAPETEVRYIDDQADQEPCRLVCNCVP